MSYFKNGVEVFNFKWTAPTANTDGSPITQALTYNLYVDGTPVLTFPGTLNPDGTYSFPIADVSAMAIDAVYSLYLTAMDEDGDESDPSNTITVERLARPNAPTAFSVE